MHQMRCLFARVGLSSVLALAFGISFGTPSRALADLIRPDASQAFPDLSGDIVGTQTYAFDPDSRTGTFQLSNTPTLLALGPKASSEFFVNDARDTIRSQSLQVKLDTGGHLLADAHNNFSLHGSVTLEGKTYTGLLLQGTPTAFGFARQNPDSPAMSVFDVNLTLKDGLLKQLYGPDAYLRVITETNSTFDGSFTRSFEGLKALTNVRGYNSPSPSAVPEPSTWVVMVACCGFGAFYGRRRIAPRELSSPG